MGMTRQFEVVHGVRLKSAHWISERASSQFPLTIQPRHAKSSGPSLRIDHNVHNGMLNT